ncbi:S-adenosyl-l-methionine hydroxide adenosyltransferase family protein [uncultured Sphaerochaeta sp.]|uniref:SAM hydrolase/SAM-dependent halogenase family protein n=1 Tax=uncultured Sphaerochaeta sp. TaxID=886478 RepID=UPI002A0A3700|nr:S-adenosyl-l-methionine hydroxide adenosyltransferase family protein [uncultured Sphaerochaeta sp.]
MDRNNREALLAGKEWEKRQTVVFLSDFGMADGAVSAMHGVANRVSNSLLLDDLTHEIPQFNIWEASYRLMQAMTYWAQGTVFVCVVDPGVGSDRKSIVALTKSGHLVVTPDNGTLTHIAQQVGIVEVREISEVFNRLEGSQKSYTFFGRDVYAYTGARLASGALAFEDVGPVLGSLVKLKIEKGRLENEHTLIGAIDILDTRYGSLWTNISGDFIERMNLTYGQLINVTIAKDGRTVFGYPIKLCRSFTEVSQGEPLIYVNSLLNLAIALNQGSFSSTYGIGTGEGWIISLTVI